MTFCEIIYIFSSHCKPEDKTQAYFKLFDFDNDGRIGINDIKQYLKNLNEKPFNLQQDVFMDFLVENGYFDLLIKMLEDPVYVFDKDYIFKCIQHIIEPENKEQIMDNLIFDHNILLNSNNNMNNEISNRSQGSSYRTSTKRGSILEYIIVIILNALKLLKVIMKIIFLDLLL